MLVLFGSNEYQKNERLSYGRSRRIKKEQFWNPIFEKGHESPSYNSYWNFLMVEEAEL